MKVKVDGDVCEANGVCASLVPEVFDLDDEDILHIRVPEVPQAVAGRVRYAVRSCPKAALRAEES